MVSREASSGWSLYHVAFLSALLAHTASSTYLRNSFRQSMA